jgi:hypothetical protein
MKNKNSMLLILAGMVTALAFILSGCSTEDPWSPNPESPLVLEMVSGPDADTVAYGSNISYSWTSRGGVPEVTYEYRVGSADWTAPSNVTTVQLPNRTADGSFSVRATDGEGTSVSITRDYYVGSAQGADTTPPTVWIDSSPAENSYIATGSSITFSWAGDDPGGAGDDLLFWWSFVGIDSDTSAARSVSFDDVMAADPAEFIVTAWDGSYHPVTWWRNDSSFTEPIADPDSIDYEMNTAEASVSFVIRDANILYIDDYQWHNAGGDIDRAKERDQKQFYRDALEGYAFAEWDYAEQGMPDSSALVSGGEPVFSTILFASDGQIGDASGTWWFDIASVGETPIHHYLESGGNFIVTGSETLPWMWNNIPPVDGDLEFDYFGVDSVMSDVIDEIDSTWWLGDSAYTEPILLPDSITVEITYLDPWVHEWWFTWAVKDENTMLNLPDSMKLDVAKQGDQDDYAAGVWSLRDDDGARTEVLFRWGLWVDGHPPGDDFYLSPVGHITSLNSGQQYTAMLNFDTYSMPLPLMRQTFQTILTEFGE